MRGILEGPNGELGEVRIVNGVAVPDELALKTIGDYDVTDGEGNILGFADGPLYLSWLALRWNGTYSWVRLEE
jgi:hypothetical protein